jgi:hypothetical protein
MSAQRLVVEIEEKLVLLNRSANRNAELLLIEVGQRNAGLVIEPVVG